MKIIITIDSELETLLCAKAAQQGKDIGAIASEYLQNNVYKIAISLS